jgi:hypothetical protein
MNSTHTAAILGAAVTLAVATGCTSPCHDAYVVQSHSDKAPYDVELDDGHVYREVHSHIFEGWPNTGRVVTLCEIRSKIDGSVHF